MITSQKDNISSVRSRYFTRLPTKTIQIFLLVKREREREKRSWPLSEKLCKNYVSWLLTYTKGEKIVVGINSKFEFVLKMKIDYRKCFIYAAGNKEEYLTTCNTRDQSVQEKTRNTCMHWCIENAWLSHHTLTWNWSTQKSPVPCAVSPVAEQ